MRWPWVSRRAYEDAMRRVDQLQERNDRLVEAISQAETRAPVVLPRQPAILEKSEGWMDHIRSMRATTLIKEN